MTGPLNPIKCGGIRECTQEEWDAMIEEIAAEKLARAQRMPDEAAALRQMFDAWTRLKELGFKEARHAPRGHVVQVIEVGSTGLHEGYLDEKTKSALFWLLDNGDLWPSRPILYRPIPETSPPPPLSGEPE
jgi:hypothetical protein